MPHRYGGRNDTELAVVLDCSDLDRAGAFWCAALGYVPVDAASDLYLSLRPAEGDGIELLLQRVPDVKVQKNRMHLDLRAPEMAAEVERLLALGARRVTDTPIEEEGWRRHILEDPDGNEFCVLQPPRRVGS